MSKSSLYFNGTNAYLQISNNFAPATNIYTVEFYMKSVGSTNAYKRIFTNTNGYINQSNIVFRENPLGSLELFIGTNNYTSLSNIEYKNKWVKVSLVANGLMTKVYIDNKKIIEGQGCITLQPQTSVFFGGYYQNGNLYSEYFQGNLTEITVLGYAKSEKEFNLEKHYYTDKLNPLVHTYFNLESQSVSWKSTKLEIVNATWDSTFPIIYQKEKILLKSRNKVYTLKSEELIHETKMTSNTTPAPIVVSSSSAYNTSSPAWKAFDGMATVSNNFWVSVDNAIPAWLTINFGEIKSVNFVDIYLNMDGNRQAYPKDFVIQGSSDGIKWVDLKKVKDENWGNATNKRFYLDRLANYKFYRLYITALNGFTRTAITELVYGVEKKLIEIPSDSTDNFINYGATVIENFNMLHTHKDYILQTPVNTNKAGLLQQNLDRKPLSIKLK